MKILHLDTNHPLLIDQLKGLGFDNDEDYSSSKPEVENKLHEYDGVVLRSRFKIDKQFLMAGKHLKFIARVGSGLENIDTDTAEELNIRVIGAPEGNCNAVGEHALALLLSLLNHIRRADNEVRQGLWRREENRGYELDGKVVGLIGYGNTGNAFARKLSGFDVKVLCYDIKGGVGNVNAKQVPLEDLQSEADVLSLHIPLTPLTHNLVDYDFILRFKKPFWFINTSRGENVVTTDLVKALKNGKILGAGLDVLEYEKASFESLFKTDDMPVAFQDLIASENVLLSPHIAGWTVESKEKLAQVIVDKIKSGFY